MLKKAFHLLMLACLFIGTSAIPTQAAPEAQLETRTTHYVMYSPTARRSSALSPPVALTQLRTMASILP